MLHPEIMRKTHGVNEEEIFFIRCVGKLAERTGFFSVFSYCIRMNVLLRFSFLLSLFLFAGCETPLADSWNDTMARLSPNRAENSDARLGLTADSRTGRDQTAYLAPQRTVSSTVSSGNGVKLKPFRQKNVPRPTPRPSPAASTGSPKKPTPTPSARPKPTPRPTREPSADSRPTPKPTEAPQPATSSEPPPFATPVPGKKGYVTSPFNPGAGFIDVTGLEPGSKARDPYSGKIFRVP